jgi:hypothetical protein
MHLDSGYDGRPSRDVLAAHQMVGEIAKKGIPSPIQVGKRCFWGARYRNPYYGHPTDLRIVAWRQRLYRCYSTPSPVRSVPPSPPR